MNDLTHPIERRDCGVRALAVVCFCSYEDAHAALKSVGRKNNCGTSASRLIKAAKLLGYKLEKRNAGGTVANIKRELPTGQWIVHTRDHFIGVDNGVALDWASESRKRIKYAYKVTRRGTK